MALLEVDRLTVEFPTRRGILRALDDVSFEIEVSLSGIYQPGYPETGPSFACAGEPGEPPSIEDMEIHGMLGLLTLNGKNADVDLFKGVDVKNPEIQKFLANLLAFCGDDAETALIEEASEW